MKAKMTGFAGSENPAFSELFPAKVIRFQSGNFTPVERTPWGGRNLLPLKAGFSPFEGEDHQRVGESWEVSVHPDFPSQVILPDGKRSSFADIVGCYPVDILGHDVATSTHGTFPLLCKFLDAAEDLSLQVHPSDQTALPGEEGKEEAWSILQAEKNACVYLGLHEGVTETMLREALMQGKDAKPYFTCVPVRAGDTFYVPPGIPHAIGGGVMLYEPQQSSSTTFRLYDWGRVPQRELHLKRALQVIDWNSPRGEKLLVKLRKRTVGEDDVEGMTDLITAKHFSLHRIFFREKGTIHRLETHGRFVVMTLIRGEVTLTVEDAGRMEILSQGSTVVLPALSQSCTLTSTHAQSLALITRPCLPI